MVLTCTVTGEVGRLVRHLLERYGDNPGFAPGDVFLCNDPYVSVCHQNCVQVVAPIFDAASIRAIATAIVGGGPGGLFAATLLKLADPSAEVVVFNSTYAAARELCVADRILVIKGRIDHKQQGETKLIALEVAAFEAVQERTEIRFKLDARVARAGLIRDLAHLVKDYPGPSMVFVSLETSLGPKTYALGPQYRVKPDSDFLAEAKSLLGEAAIQ